MSNNSAPPGWYPNAHDGRQWYWDGQNWSPAGPNPSPPGNRKVLKWLGIAALVLLFLGMCGAYVAKDGASETPGTSVTRTTGTASNGMSREKFFSVLDTAWSETDPGKRADLCNDWRNSPELRNTFIDAFIRGAELDGTATDRAWVRESFNQKCSTS